MGEILQKSAFTLIKSPKRREVTKDSFPLPYQAELFSAYAPNLLILVTFPKATAEEFMGVLEHTRPGVVIDLRLFPRFDVGSLSRQKVFKEFETRRILYFDFARLSDDPRQLDFSTLNQIAELRVLSGVIMILLEDRPYTMDVAKALHDHLATVSHAPWDVVQVPSYLPARVSSDLQFG